MLQYFFCRSVYLVSINGIVFSIHQWDYLTYGFASKTLNCYQILFFSQWWYANCRNEQKQRLQPLISPWRYGLRRHLRQFTSAVMGRILLKKKTRDCWMSCWVQFFNQSSSVKYKELLQRRQEKWLMAVMRSIFKSQSPCQKKLLSCKWKTFNSFNKTQKFE